MNQVANTTKPQTDVALKSETKRASLIETMAAEYNMEPALFTGAVKKTAMPSGATNEEFAAFMIVAHEYGLNPFLRELYAFPKKGGGIVPMVSIDGWVNIINKQPLLAGFELEQHYDNDKKLAAVTCRMHRKDRILPVVVTEYMIECFRSTDPWRQMPNRMLRHKALIQAARYAFGLGGIYDEDEAKDIAGMKDITPAPRPKPQDFVIPAKTIQSEQPQPEEYPEKEQPKTETVNAETGEVGGDDEYGPADAHREGMEAALAGKGLDAMPRAYRQLPDINEAWESGWQSEQPEGEAK